MIRLETPDLMTSLKSSHLPSTSYLRELHILDVVGNHTDSTGDSRMDAIVASACGGQPQVCSDPRQLPGGAAAMIAVPLHRGCEVVSVVAMMAKSQLADHQPTAGVFEVWKHVPPHDELALMSGSYGAMERFAGVSRFVRFEKGSGLPGQVWDQNLPIIHDDLTNHPGFLRAAGASAEILRTAIGFPITSGDGGWIASVLLISSTVSPLARGFEVWKADAKGYELSTAAYHDLGDSYRLPAGCRAPEGSVADLAAMHGTAILTEESETLMAGREPSGASTPGPTAALAMPFYDGETLRSVAALLF